MICCFETETVPTTSIFCRLKTLDRTKAQAPNPMPPTITRAMMMWRRRLRRWARTSRRRWAMRGERTTRSAVRTIRNLLELADQLQLGLELDPRILAHHPLDLAEQGIDVVRAGVVFRHDEIGVDLADARATDLHTLPADLLDEPRGVIARRVLEDAAAVRKVERLRSPPPLLRLVHPGDDLIVRPGSQRDRCGRHDRAARQVRPPVREPRIFGRDPPRRTLREHEHVDGRQHLCDLVAVGARVHTNRTAEARRDRNGELKAGKCVVHRERRDRRQRHRTAGLDRRPRCLRPSETCAQPQRDAVEPPVRHEHVRPAADHEHRHAALLHGSRECLEVIRACRLEQHIGRSAEPVRSQRRDRTVALDVPVRALGQDARGNVSTVAHRAARASRLPNISSQSIVTSPAPIVSTRSPGNARSAMYGTMSPRFGRYATRRRGSASRTPSTTIFPVMPGCGSSRAPYTSVTTTRSAAESAAPSSRPRCIVREYRCGWNTATRRRGACSRAAARTARTFDGLCA